MGLSGPVAHGVLARGGPAPRSAGSPRRRWRSPLEVLELRLLRLEQGGAEGQVLRPVHGAVDVVGVALVVAAGPEGHRQVDALALHDRAGGIEEVAGLAAGEGAQVVGQLGGRERPGGQHGDLVGLGQPLLGAPFHRDQGMGLDGGGEGGAVAAPVDGQGAAGGHRMGIGGADDHRTQAPQLLLEQAGGAVGGEGPEAVAAHQFGELAAVVRGGAPHRPHFHQPYRNSGGGDLPGGFGAGEAGTDDEHHQARARLIISCSWPTAARPMLKPAQPTARRIGAATSSSRRSMAEAVGRMVGS